MTGETDVFGSGFFTTPFQWEAASGAGQDQRKAPRLRRFAMMAGLAAATVVLRSTGVDGVGPNVSSLSQGSHFADSLVSPSDVIGHHIPARPADYLAPIQAGNKARSRASRILEAGSTSGVPADRAVGIANGGIAVYWLSKDRLDGGAAARFAMFECEKDSANLILSNHDPKEVRVFEVKVANLEQMVQRAIAFTA